MSKFELKLPKMGESVAEATITSWLKNVGDTIELDESIVEIATDKVDSDVPSEVEGVLVEILYQVDDVVQVGKTIAIIETDTEVTINKDTDKPKIQENKIVISPTVETIKTDTKKVEETITDIRSTFDNFYSPLVKNIAKTENISMAELKSISGSGKDQRVTKEDILDYIKSRNISTIKTPEKLIQKTVITNPKTAQTPLSISGEDEIIEMTRMGKLISSHMVNSAQTAAHVQSFIEVDVTNVVKWRDKVKDDFLKREGEKITFTPIFMQAIAKTLKEYPMINISVDGDKVIKRKDINLGMAAALADGNLIVPVIKKADLLNLVGMTKAVNDLANRARNGKLKPDDIQGGTYTVTNIGSFGSIMGTPIINQPQVAILALGAIRKMPAVIETPDGDFIGIRHKMIISHSYDHRVVNGALGGMFIKRVAEYLEAFDVNRAF
ncbi:MAG: 2-oxo acid dehydrogenase subunit E2 [Flavobacteriaceae bacterium]|nr:2-oxo acid dehydrogenase subunit E2 [Flavobacteriaceae bacterium]